MVGRVIHSLCLDEVHVKPFRFTLVIDSFSINCILFSTFAEHIVLRCLTHIKYLLINLEFSLKHSACLDRWLVVWDLDEIRLAIGDGCMKILSAILSILLCPKTLLIN